MAPCSLSRARWALGGACAASCALSGSTDTFLLPFGIYPFYWLIGLSCMFGCWKRHSPAPCWQQSCSKKSGFVFLVLPHFFIFSVFCCTLVIHQLCSSWCSLPLPCWTSHTSGTSWGPWYSHSLGSYLWLFLCKIYSGFLNLFLQFEPIYFVFLDTGEFLECISLLLIIPPPLHSCANFLFYFFKTFCG